MITVRDIATMWAVSNRSLVLIINFLAFLMPYYMYMYTVCIHIMPLPFSLAAPPPDVFAASKAVPLMVNIFMLSLHLQVITALPGKKLIMYSNFKSE